MQVAKNLQDLNGFYLEQPCGSYSDCLWLRHRCQLPMVLDECVSDLKSVVKTYEDRAADVLDLKIAKFGGISKTKSAIDFCVNMGIPMAIVDTWGTDLTTAAILNLCATIPPPLLFRAANFISYNGISIGSFLDPSVREMRSPQEGLVMKVPLSSPGLGIQLNKSVLKEAIFVIE